MGLTATQKIIKSHLIKGEMVAGNEIEINIDQTLTQDSTGTMTYLQFEALGIDKVKTKRSVAYIDHNMLQNGPENADDHIYIQTAAKKYGIYFSKPGNGICHQVNLERFGIPGQTLLGSDSHTPTAGGIGMLAIGAGGLDVAVAMGGGAYHITMPQIVKIDLLNKLSSGVSAKDIILEILRKLSVKGGVGKIFEYCGEGVKELSVPERATITNMGAELGATSSVFPSDSVTLNFLKAQGRESDFNHVFSDEDSVYDEEILIDLSKIEPLASCPHSPDNVKEISELKGIKVNQVAIGSCTNSSFADMMKVANILEGKTISENVSLVITPGSRQVLTMLSQNGALTKMIAAGARVLECACGPCIGMGQSPSSDAVSLRTFNRNFKGRSGTISASVYLVSPETAAVSALTGFITDPRTSGEIIDIKMPEIFNINDNLIVSPSESGANVKIIRGPNIMPFPLSKPIKNFISGIVLTKLGDNITTDDIMPSNAKLLPYRSNVPYLSDYCMTPVDAEFPRKAKLHEGGFIVGGTNYGQGSSREHAALVPLYLGIKAVLAKSFARIHKENLINNGILPLIFENLEDYSILDELDELEIVDAKLQINKGIVVIKNKTKNLKLNMLLNITERQKDILLAGGLLNLINAHHN
jgi:aconitate hydratase